MKYSLFLLLLSFSILSFENGFAQKDTMIRQEVQADISSQNAQDERVRGDDDFSPILLFLPFVLISILASVLAAIILPAIVALIILVFISLGIVSASILVGLWKRSFTKGFKVFILLFSSFGGILIGGVTFGILNVISHWTRAPIAILSGSAAGAVCGLIFGYLAFYTIKKLIAFLIDKLEIKSDEYPQ